MTIKFGVKIVDAQNFHGGCFKSLVRAAKQVVDLLANDKTVGTAACMKLWNRMAPLSRNRLLGNL